jgi:hypothetical protein
MYVRPYTKCDRPETEVQHIKYWKTLSLKRRPRGEVHVHAGSVFRVLLIFSPLNARFFWLFVITFP